jgi:hypothetical protein
MDKGDIIAVMIGGVVFFAAVIAMLFAKIRKSEAEVVAVATEPSFVSSSIAEIHHKYDEMAETDPITAGRLKYAELLKHHGE